MAVSMDDFLLQYYMQRRFNTMPPEVRAQFDVYVKADDFRGHMKDWKKKLMHLDPAINRWVQNAMPDPTDQNDAFFMENGDWEKLFKAFQNAFRKMASRRKSFRENTKATAFLDEYFGNATSHLFSNNFANQVAEQEINGKFKDFLTKYRRGLEIYLKQWGLLDGDFSFSDLMSGISSKKYNSDPTFQDKIKTIAQYLTVYGNQSDFQQAIGIQPQDVPDFNDTYQGFDSAQIDPAKLAYFQRNYKDLLNTLAKESKIFDEFKKYDDGKISKFVDLANENIDFANKDSKDYVPPKRDDELTPFQQIRKNVSDTWSDYMDKYTKLRGDRLYFSPSAKLIVKAIDGTKFSPTDGLSKLLKEKTGDIKKNLMYKSPRAVDHFDWMTKALGDIESTMPKAFAGALKNGRQMGAIVEEMVMRAVRENKIDEAKTAMEVLSVIKYGYTTSKIMDTLRADKGLFTIFSDGGLSWNKNEGVKFVTNAMDKTIRFAFLTAGYALAGVGNAIRLNGSKFNGKTGRMKKEHDAWVAKNDADRNSAIAQRNAENQIDIANRQPHENTLLRLEQAGFNTGTIDQKKADLETAKNDAEQKHTAFTNAKQLHDDAQGLIDQDDDFNNALVQLQNDNTNLANDIARIDALLNNPATFAGMQPAVAGAHANFLMMQRTQKQNQIQKNNNDINRITQERAQIPANDLANARAHIAQYTRDMQNAERDYNSAQQIADDLTTNIGEYENAKQLVAELTANIERRNNAVTNWDQEHQDKYKELMAYWDLLESGRDSHTGIMYSWMFGSAKKKQAKFDANKDAIVAQHLSNYSLVA